MSAKWKRNFKYVLIHTFPIRIYYVSEDHTDSFENALFQSPWLILRLILINSLRPCDDSKRQNMLSRPKVQRPHWVNSLAPRRCSGNAKCVIHKHTLVKSSLDECQRISLNISQHWFRQWLGAVRHQAITWSNVDQVSWPHITPPAAKELMARMDSQHTRNLEKYFCFSIPSCNPYLTHGMYSLLRKVNDKLESLNTHMTNPIPYGILCRFSLP